MQLEERRVHDPATVWECLLCLCAHVQRCSFSRPMCPRQPLQVRAGRWLASLNLAGELYQGFFSTEQEAAEAIVLAGFTQPAVSS